jgi:hypothetical protein
MDKELKHGDVVFINVENDFDWTDEGYHYINKKLNNKIGIIITEGVNGFYEFYNVEVDNSGFLFLVRPEFVTKVGELYS